MDISMGILFDHYTKRIKKATVLDDICVEFSPKTVYAIRGENGSGKTMLLRAACGFIRATSGRVLIDGIEVGKGGKFPSSIGVLIENPAFLNQYTGLRNLELLAGIRGEVNKDEISKAMTAVGLDPEDKRPYRKYSLGMKQKLGIACAVMEKPSIVLLDEPYNALDPESRERITCLIANEKKRGALVVVACHNTQEINAISDEIIQIEHGRIGGRNC